MGFCITLFVRSSKIRIILYGVGNCRGRANDQSSIAAIPIGLLTLRTMLLFLIDGVNAETPHRLVTPDTRRIAADKEIEHGYGYSVARRASSDGIFTCCECFGDHFC